MPNPTVSTSQTNAYYQQCYDGISYLKPGEANNYLKGIKSAGHLPGFLKYSVNKVKNMRESGQDYEKLKHAAHVTSIKMASLMASNKIPDMAVKIETLNVAVKTKLQLESSIFASLIVPVWGAINAARKGDILASVPNNVLGGLGIIANYSWLCFLIAKRVGFEKELKAAGESLQSCVSADTAKQLKSLSLNKPENCLEGLVKTGDFSFSGALVVIKQLEMLRQGNIAS